MTAKNPESRRPTDVLVNFVLDKSGSMHDVAAATVSGFNEFLQGQRAGEGKALMSLTLFSTEFDVRTVAVDVHEVPDLGTKENPYSPNGMTALYDAVATTIAGTDAWLLAHRKFTGKVICVIQTDGGENSSKTTSLEALNSLIEHKTANEGWEFVFMGVGAGWTEGQKFSAIPESAKYAVPVDGASNRAMYGKLSRGMTTSRMTGASYAASVAADEDQVGNARP